MKRSDITIEGDIVSFDIKIDSTNSVLQFKTKNTENLSKQKVEDIVIECSELVNKFVTANMDTNLIKKIASILLGKLVTKHNEKNIHI